MKSSYDDQKAQISSMLQAENAISKYLNTKHITDS